MTDIYENITFPQLPWRAALTKKVLTTNWWCCLLEYEEELSWSEQHQIHQWHPLWSVSCFLSGLLSTFPPFHWILWTSYLIRFLLWLLSNHYSRNYCKINSEYNSIAQSFWNSLFPRHGFGASLTNSGSAPIFRIKGSPCFWDGPAFMFLALHRVHWWIQGALGTPPLGPIFFHFHAVWRKNYVKASMLDITHALNFLELSLMGFVKNVYSVCVLEYGGKSERYMG